MYHAITTGARKPSWPWAVSLTRFREHLDCLAALGYATVTVDELAHGPHKGRVVALTFDDGYANNLAVVDELVRRGMRATWFVVTGSIGVDPGWHDLGRPPGRMLNASELRTMRSAGMQIGSHTVSHAPLPEVSDTDLERELTLSRNVLEGVLGEPVTSFAYPYGRWDLRCEDAVRSAGYRVACTTQTGWALRDSDPLRIRRLAIFNRDDRDRFARKIALGSMAVGWDHTVRYLATRLASKLTGRG